MLFLVDPRTILRGGTTHWGLGSPISIIGQTYLYTTKKAAIPLLRFSLPRWLYFVSCWQRLANTLPLNRNISAEITSTLMPLKILLHIKGEQLWKVRVQPRFKLRKYILFHWSAWENQTAAQSVIKLFKHRCGLAKNVTDSSDHDSNTGFILLWVCVPHIVIMGLLSPVYEMWPITLQLRVALKIERNIYLQAMRQVEEFFASFHLFLESTF